MRLTVCTVVRIVLCMETTRPTTSTTNETGETYAEAMAARDGALRIICPEGKGFAKIVRDGETLARIDSYTDGTFSTTSYGRGPLGGVVSAKRTEVASWAIASYWLTSQTLSEVLS
jgi:hypothetical protein